MGLRDTEELVAERELALDRRIELMEVDLAALRMHRDLVTAQLDKALREHAARPPAVKGFLVGLALATVLFLLTALTVL